MISFGGLITADISEEVLKVNGDGSFTVFASTENQVVILGGPAVPAGVAPGIESTYAASGQILKIESAQMDADAYRFASLMNIMWPRRQVHADWVWTIDSGLSVSSSWTVKTDADSDKGTFDMTFSYRILGRETSHGFDCFKIKFENRETSGGGASSEGTVWIDVKTGLTVKVDGDVYGAPMMGRAIDGHFLMELED